jgi:hypothetical protein
VGDQALPGTEGYYSSLWIHQACDACETKKEQQGYLSSGERHMEPPAYLLGFLHLGPWVLQESQESLGMVSCGCVCFSRVRVHMYHLIFILCPPKRETSDLFHVI